MIYRFVMLSDETDQFKREFKIDAAAKFIDLHKLILDSVNYQDDQLRSFFICEPDWTRKTQITLIEMDMLSEEDSYIMTETALEDLLEEEHQRLVYVFDTFNDRVFYLELREIILKQNLETPICSKSVGDAPVKILEIETNLHKDPHPHSPNNEFFEEDSEGFDPEEINEAGFENIDPSQGE